ncbi:hypothetical protein TWF481_007511 [Arthrobotrys musiformis]|uniref:Uncharacterized protein n=1 Tax=Arthrobotrys musiformis TaxID=47236 RepID=A0AAV9WDQ3_9PEZI
MQRPRLSNRALLFAFCIGAACCILPFVHARPQDHHYEPTATTQEFDPVPNSAPELDNYVPGLEARGVVPIFRGIGEKVRSFTLANPASVPTGLVEPPVPEPSGPGWAPPLEGEDRTKEEDFNGRECKVGLYKHPWFRNTEPGYGWKSYTRWEGYPLGRSGSLLQKQQRCWNIADVKPDLLDEIRYSVTTGHCDCKFYTKPDCQEHFLGYSRHDSSGELPRDAWAKIESFRCLNNDHYDDFEYCHVTLTNGGDAHEPNGKYNLYFNLLDGYSELQFWYQELYFDRDTIRADKAAGGSRCWAPDPPERQRREGWGQYIRYANASGCSCSIYQNDDCTGEVLREVGGYGTDVQFNWPSTPYIQPGSVRCWTPYGLVGGKRLDKGPNRKSTSFEANKAPK